MAVHTQGSQPYSLEDTVLLLLDEVLDDDLSSEGDDLTLLSGGSYETNSAVRAITGATGRELYVQTTIDPTDTGAVLLWHGSQSAYADHTYAIELNSATISFSQNGTVLYNTEATLTEQGYHIHWSTRPNPDTTGAGDAVVSEFMIVQAGDYEVVEIRQVAHAVSSTNAAWALAVGGWWTGASLKGEPTYPVQNVRIGVAHHPNAEWYEEWVDQRPAHGSTKIKPPVLLPLDIASGLADMGQWAGASNIGWCAAHSNALRGRMLTNLVNDVYRDAATHRNTFTPAQRWSDAPDGSTYKLDVTKLRWVQVPRGVDNVFVRVQVQSWVTAGATVPIGLACYSFNRPFRGVGPTLGGAPTPAFDFRKVEATLSVNNGSSGTGQWVTLGVLPLARYQGDSAAWSDTTLLALGLVFDPAGATVNDASGRVKIKGWHVRPMLGD